MFLVDFRPKVICSSLLRWFLVISLALMQQLLLVPFLENVAQPTLNFTSVESIFEEIAPLKTIGNPTTV